jgi:hypothetical protein
MPTPPRPPRPRPARPEVADHHEPGGNADANLELAEGGRVEPSDRGDHVEAGAHGPLGIVFVGARIAEINQHAVAHVFGDETVEAANRPETQR